MKTILLTAALLFVIPFLHGEEAFVKVKEDTLAWLYGTNSALSTSNTEMIIPKDTFIQIKGVYVKTISPELVNSGNYGKEKYAFISKFDYNDMRLLIQTSMLVPDNSNLFDESLLTDISDGNRDTWIMEHYVSILLSGNRDGFEEYEREFIAIFNHAGGWEKWYDVMPNYSVESLQLMQTFINVGGFDARQFCIFNIVKIESGHKITVFENGDDIIGSTCIIPFPKDRKIFELLLIYDNDYMEMYLDSMDNHLATFVKVNKSIQDEIKNLMRDNRCDLSNITYWPKRRNKQIETGKPYRTAAILRLRADEDRNSEIITEMPENTAVVVLETGAEDTIDSIKANWVKIRLADGTEGWCFGGYLLADVPVESGDTRQNDTDPELSQPEGNAPVVAQQPGIALPLIIALAAAGILVAAGVVVFLLRWKK